jgi:hypothetical protein
MPNGPRPRPVPPPGRTHTHQSACPCPSTCRRDDAAKRIAASPTHDDGAAGGSVPSTTPRHTQTRTIRTPGARPPPNTHAQSSHVDGSGAQSGVSRGHSRGNRHHVDGVAATQPCGILLKLGPCRGAGRRQVSGEARGGGTTQGQHSEGRETTMLLKLKAAHSRHGESTKLCLRPATYVLERGLTIKPSHRSATASATRRSMQAGSSQVGTGLWASPEPTRH